ncbi:MAG: outer membrane beta-barrel protein [Vicinamibacterales bacterium]
MTQMTPMTQMTQMTLGPQMTQMTLGPQMTQMTRTPSREPARRRRRTALLVAILAVLLAAAPASAQAKEKLRIGGYAMAGGITFASSESFDAVLGTHSGPLFGGGARVGLPWFGLFVDLGAWRFKDEGERVLQAGGTLYKLGIPVTITITPIELTGGWQFHGRRGIWRRLGPYVGAGLSSYSYKETSTFATTSENADDRFSGYHLLGGAEYKVLNWLGIAGEAAWSTIPDALGTAGISKEFGETELGGTSFRMKITVGR